MKKLLAFLLAAVMLLALAACQNDTPTTPDAPKEPDGKGNVTEGAYSFTLGGVELIPGTAFDASALPEAESVTQVPSCANQGTDNLYNYGTVEVTAFNDGSGEVIYSVYIFDPNTPTPEGLYLGDGLEQVETLYGTDYTTDGTQLTFQKGETLLILLLENDQVISIDYRWAFE